MENIVTVGIGDCAVAKSPGVLETLSLGSCVGIALFDPVVKIGGLAHIMLPDSSARGGRDSQGYRAKYADTAIALMLGELFERGAARERLVAKLAGGAKMFEMMNIDPVGERNLRAVRNVLMKEGILIVAEETGKNYGRTVRFDLDTGRMAVSSMRYGTKDI